MYLLGSMSVPLSLSSLAHCEAKPAIPVLASQRIATGTVDSTVAIPAQYRWQTVALLGAIVCTGIPVAEARCARRPDCQSGTAQHVFAILLTKLFGKSATNVLADATEIPMSQDGLLSEQIIIG
jgi:hypothetical protein